MQKKQINDATNILKRTLVRRGEDAEDNNEW